MTPRSPIQRLNEALRFAKRTLPPTVEKVDGPTLNLYRVASGVSAAAVAQRLDVSKQRISAMETSGASLDLAGRYRAAVDQIAAE